MEAIGSEVGLKMRCAIKAKLMELGCYVDDELPDYVMVMVANKRTRSQMEDDLQLFLSSNTEAFVGWLHQVLQKLQEVTINTKLVTLTDVTKKSKGKRPDNPTTSKKEKRKEKEKLKTKQKVKLKKSKKDKSKKYDTIDKTKELDEIRPNVPHLLINLEKESAPSITDIFAGQILKTHGILSNSASQLSTPNSDKIDNTNDEDRIKRKLIRNRFPIINSESIPQIESNSNVLQEGKDQDETFENHSGDELSKPVESESNTSTIVEDDSANPKSKSDEHVDSVSEGEDFINLRTEAEDLIGVELDEEASMQSSENRNISCTPPLVDINTEKKSTENSTTLNHEKDVTKSPILVPQIELILPKRPTKERLGVREQPSESSNKNFVYKINNFQPNKATKNPSYKEDNIISDRQSEKIPAVDTNKKVSIKSRLTLRVENVCDSSKSSNKDEQPLKRRIGSRVFPIQAQHEPMKNNTNSVASIVRAPPRPQSLGISAAPQLLLRAVADAQKSLLNMPPKVQFEPSIKKKVRVHPIRRNVNPQKIIIEVPSNNIPLSKTHENQDSNSDFELDIDTESLGDLENDRDALAAQHNEFEYVPEPLGIKPQPFKADYVPTHISSTKRKKDGISLDSKSVSKILNPTSKESNEHISKDPQFVVTLDGLDPNVFLEKKLEMINSQDSENEDSPESLIANEKLTDPKKNSPYKSIESSNKDVSSTQNDKPKTNNATMKKKKKNDKPDLLHNLISEKVLNPTSEIKEHDINTENVDKKVSNSSIKETPSKETSVITRKRKGSPITFFTEDSKTSKTISKTESKSKDRSNIANKYDALQSLPPDRQRILPLTSAGRERCRFFPDCRHGAACEFYHHPPTASPMIRQTTLCRAFPLCTYGDKCVYSHPACKFNTSCIRKDCPYSHIDPMKSKLSAQPPPTLSPAIASHVVPASNYKSITAIPLPSMCKFHPNCVNSGCPWYHPKPCRFGKYCINKVECNFYHHNISSLKWKSSHQT